MANFGVDSDGSIEGYGAYFGNVDSHSDSIDRGAFADTIAKAKRTGRMPALLLQHAMGSQIEDSLPLGTWADMTEDGSGLYVKGRLALGNRRADDVHALIRAGALNGLSIGFVAKRFTMLPKGGDVRRRLHAIDLREISVVHYPSNDLARIHSVKAEGDLRALSNLAASLRS
ncbi:HK97 family phage prohead protease [Bradyrhizobium sp. CB1717]|uniref:HK97 family phage prohead protease n=1 Tax=Bradyrhizobium sp. CB1717 TaxID=3039154 RepID=UPI0024B18012|nr:HK97 family phage prohead protease [Bradyrhizobium sp. CB1717]WFU23152.1 HK97 family phage prohead protease [Bradyrhizobium sp. CB1717]